MISYDLYIHRWLSYRMQIKLTLDLYTAHNTILEVGMGTGFFRNYMDSIGIPVKTVDIDATLQPDIISDVRSLDLPDDSVDISCCFQVLEHIPFSDFPASIAELARVSKKAVLISLPCSGQHFSVALKFPLVGKLFKQWMIWKNITVPVMTRPDSSNHLWEINHPHTINEIWDILKIHFSTIHIHPCIMNPYHTFLELR